MDKQPGIRRRLAGFPFLLCRVPGDRYVNRSILSFKECGRKSIRHMEYLRHAKPAEFHAEMDRREREQDYE